MVLDDKEKEKRRDLRTQSVLVRQKVIRMVGFLILSFMVCRLPFFTWHFLQTIMEVPVPDIKYCIKIHHTLNSLVTI